MIHYSCDRCQRRIDAEQEIRYSVTIETHAAIDQEAFDDSENRDHLCELQSLLEQLEDDERQEISEVAYQQQRFDLCGECHRQFVKNPLGSDVAVALGFSDN